MKSYRALLLIFILFKITSCKNFPEKQLREAEKIVLNGDYVNALKVYDDIIEKDSSIEIAFFERGKIRGLLNDTEGAINDMDYVIALKPNSIEPYLCKAESLRKSGNNIAALSMLDLAIRNKKGVIYKSGEVLAVVERAYANQNVVNNNYDILLEFILFERAMCLINIKEYNKGLDDLDYCVDHMERYYQDVILRERGELLIYLNQNERGCEDLKISIELGNNESLELFNKWCN